MKTYVVEDVNKQVIEYCHTLRAAKYIAVSYGGYRIYSLQGDYFGEGYHKHEWIFENNKWTRYKLN